MRLVIEPTTELVGAFTSEYVVERFTKWFEDHGDDDDAVFAVCLTGRGPVMSTLLGSLVDAHRSGAFSFRKVAVFATDEFVREDVLHPSSQHAYLWHKLFKHVDILRENVHVLDGGAKDLVAECRAYEEAIRAAGGLQLAVAESGRSGELGRNAPGSSLTSRTRRTLINYDVAQAVAQESFGGDVASVPRECLTIGVGSLLDAREILVLFCGIEKSMALKWCVESTLTHMWPVSAIQTHKCCMLIADEDATEELRVATVRYFEGLQRTAQLDRLEAISHLTHQPSQRRLHSPKRDVHSVDELNTSLE